jgi:uncharacterized membrane protein
MKNKIPLFIKILLILVIAASSFLLFALFYPSGPYIVFGGFGLLVLASIIAVIVIDKHYK